jgi:hypothetical protein
VEPADPYLALLEAVIERAVALARPAAGAGSVIDVGIASRSAPLRKRAAAHAAAAGERPGRSRREAVAETPGGEVVIGKPVVESLSNPRAHPGLVLADFVANHLRSVTVAASWKDVETYAADRLRLKVQIASEPLAASLPSMAAWGPAREAIARACGGEPALLRGEGWHAEQARAWIQAIVAAPGSAR